MVKCYSYRGIVPSTYQGIDCNYQTILLTCCTRDTWYATYQYHCKIEESVKSVEFQYTFLIIYCTWYSKMLQWSSALVFFTAQRIAEEKSQPKKLRVTAMSPWCGGGGGAENCLYSVNTSVIGEQRSCGESTVSYSVFVQDNIAQWITNNTTQCLVVEAGDPHTSPTTRKKSPPHHYMTGPGTLSIIYWSVE